MEKCWWKFSLKGNEKSKNKSAGRMLYYSVWVEVGPVQQKNAH